MQPQKSIPGSVSGCFSVFRWGRIHFFCEEIVEVPYALKTAVEGDLEDAGVCGVQKSDRGLQAVQVYEICEGHIEYVVEMAGHIVVIVPEFGGDILQ